MLKQILIGLAIITLTLTLLAGCVSPEQQAAATATVIRAQSLATTDALNNSRLSDSNVAAATSAAGQHYATVTAVAASNQGTQTAIANSAIATSASISISVNATRAANQYQATATAQAEAFQIAATQTAVPLNAGIVESNTNNLKARDSILTFAFLGGVIVVGMLILALVALVRREAGTLKRDRSGQLPAYIKDGQVIDPGRSLVPVTGVRREDGLYTLWRVYEFFRTGHLPESKTALVGNDLGLEPEQLLEAMKISIQPTTAAAMFQGADSKGDRAGRIENAQQLVGGNPLLLARPNTQVSQPSESLTQFVLAMLKPSSEGAQNNPPLIESGSPSAVVPDPGKPE